MSRFRLGYDTIVAVTMGVIIRRLPHCKVRLNSIPHNSDVAIDSQQRRRRPCVASMTSSRCTVFPAMIRSPVILLLPISRRSFRQRRFCHCTISSCSLAWVEAKLAPVETDGEHCKHCGNMRGKPALITGADIIHR